MKVPAVFWEVSIPAAVILWRALTYPLANFWRDWIVLLGAYWIFSALGSRTRAWPYVTAATMAGLLALYAGSQLPNTLAALGRQP